MIDDHFEEYQRMRKEGHSPKEAYLHAEASGLDLFARIRMLPSTFGLSLVEAKEVSVTADGNWSSLSEYQGTLLPALKAALKSRPAVKRTRDKK